MPPPDTPERRRARAVQRYRAFYETLAFRYLILVGATPPLLGWMFMDSM